MDDFGNVGLLKVNRQTTAVYELFAIQNKDGTSPSLTVRPATEANPAYYQQVVARTQGSTGRQLQQGMTPALLAKLREEDVELYADTVIVGWKNVVNSRGEQSQFTPDNVKGFLRALAENAPDVFDELRAFCASNRNFRGTPVIDPRSAAGNS